jgi:signal transduction histidine kinase
MDSLLLRLVANQVAITLQHATLLLRHERGERLLSVRASQQAAVARLGLRAVTGIPLMRLLEEAVDVVRGTLEADFCQLFELARDGESLSLTAGAGWRPGVVGQVRVGAGLESHAGYTLRVREPVVVDDLRQERRFAVSPLLREHGVIGSISVIIHDRYRPFGVLEADTCGRRTFTPDDVHFLQSVANLLAAAVQRHHVEAERERLLLQTQRAVAARDRAVGIVSHDLGNSLSTIGICTLALLDPVPPSVEGVREMAEIIQRSTAWIQQIARDLLDRTSLDADRLALQRQPVAVSEVIGAAQVMFALAAEERAVRFVVETDADLPRVDADARRVLQVLSNLLSNAMKFTPAGGRVVLSARASPEAGLAVRIAVRDTGPGIPPEDLDHVFDWFWHSERKGRSGTGLGLAIASGLIEAHGRRLHVESVVGQGSTFWFTLPAAD